jgi:hypothetical protein
MNPSLIEPARSGVTSVRPNFAELRKGDVCRTPHLRTRENKESGILGFLLWSMADRFNVVAVRI